MQRTNRCVHLLVQGNGQRSAPQTREGYDEHTFAADLTLLDDHHGLEGCSPAEPSASFAVVLLRFQPTQRIMMELEIANKRFQLLILQRHLAESWIKFMQRCSVSRCSQRARHDIDVRSLTVSNLVDGLLLLSVQFTVLIDGINFEEISAFAIRGGRCQIGHTYIVDRWLVIKCAHFIARGEEILVPDMILLVRGEFSLPETTVGVG
jgi:hypothetical protein